MADVPLILGHRGFSAKYPENTKISFRKAMEQGAQGVELDVQLSKDGVVIVLHDDSVERTTGDRSGSVSELCWTTLRTLNAAYQRPDLAWEPIPSLAEVLDDLMDFSDGLCHIEIKPCDRWRDLVKETLQVVRAHPYTVRYASFDPKILGYLKTLEPAAECGLLLTHLDLTEKMDVKTGLGLDLSAIHLFYRNVSCELVNQCHQSGMEVAAWTVDHADDVIRLNEMGVDVIISNQVDETLAALSRLSGAACGLRALKN